MDIGIIGGADGPTKTFISASKSPFLISIVIVLIIGIGMNIWSKRKNRVNMKK